MHYHHFVTSSPERYLASDEVLLELCEQGQGAELLLFWEPSDYFVVVGYANRVQAEVNVAFCETRGIPILRRCSGGGTVLQGPGCFNYSLILRVDDSGPLRNIHSANEYIMGRQQAALSKLLCMPVEKQGHTDLVLDGRKFSGNAQRRRRHFLLFHGSFLLNMNIGLIQQALRMPSKQPDYRVDRAHTDFLVNLDIPATALEQCLLQAWGATEQIEMLPTAQIGLAAETKYADRQWNYRF